MKRPAVLAFGEILWDLLPGGERLGGAPFNFAYRVHSLGMTGLMASRVGRDDYGERALARVNELGMDARLLQVDAERPTGRVEVRLDENRQPGYFIVPGMAYDRIEWTDELAAAAAEADCLCYGTLIQRTPDSRGTLQRLIGAAPGALKLLDLNLRNDCHTPEIIESSLGGADGLKLNADELEYLQRLFSLPDGDIDNACGALLERFDLRFCVVTLGEFGAFAMRRGGERVYKPGYQVDLKDPCGSGDAFAAGFMHQWFGNKPLAECCRFGNALGALVAGQTGATEPVSAETIRAFLDEAPRQSVEPGLAKFELD